MSESMLSNKVGAVSDRADASTPWVTLSQIITVPLSRSYPLGQVCRADKAESRFACTTCMKKASTLLSIRRPR